ncbi:rho guanine nucleotide exchange factor 16 [Elephas maximus indicus]|uniref:rho guanine nucleotide exchange factor 16 n=1 Tax=Elephas maximus indicus TaxID=99487 RepID=UPI0021170CE1|nr:rho guanine nucleotide exchange factor 16 [Elephas maximus indicus]XP_049733639.1 rho guanine nucleotide exchange factor 16 [Elephas maximus indicus]XP_049733640.1 rho guanine nucleotide exchange factor 16 [Elephas maximus indicus]XP_049733641.1 rho guanine nucleotide exchange factor 16 [Elephas maximus indicus]XP_049733643.1 rho guanine nucleotide exchange factor 16 [Elephas maximus indicus]XP_049733644.1 rho guanine nucleotide exchange factor 16 [Elephas maximus indicus]
MSQRYSDSSLDEKLLEYRFHSELQLDANGNPACGLPMVRGSLRVRDRTTSEPEAPAPPEDIEPRPIVLSTQSPAALKMGTQQLIPRSLAVHSRAKAPARHQSFGAAMLSNEAVRRGPGLPSGPSFSLDDLDVDAGSGGNLRRNLRNQSYRAAMKGPGTLGSEGGPTQLSPRLQALAEEPSQPPARAQTKHKRTLGRKRAHKGSFKDDPQLYQEIRERGLNTSHESDDDGLEDNASLNGPQRVDTTIVVKSYRPAQITWSQLPEVVELGILDTLPAEERKRQEAIFEILTSEFSYQHSLGVLVAEFLKSKELRATVTQTEHHHLFSNILDVLGASQRFFEDLEQRHKEQVCVEDISDILEEHAEQHFHPYVVYCSNEVYQQRTLQRLLSSNAAFREALQEIERRPACGGLPMISFLILPMQRVTRLPLLTDTLCLKTQGHPERYKAASRALKAISKLVKQCNEGARRMERTEQMYTLNKQLDFGKIKSLGLISASRWLLKRGELSLVEDAGLFRKIASRPTSYLFLFNDVLVVTKKKSEDSYAVQDYAQIEHIEVQKMEPSDLPLPGGSNRTSTVPYTFLVTMLHNSEGRQEQILLSAESASDRARWITALRHRERQWQDHANKGDLLQVEVTKAYFAKQADEVSLQQADVVLVLEQEDGWLYGERLRDGETGWFPEDFARSITSRVAVEDNVRRMERLRVETDR